MINKSIQVWNKILTGNSAEVMANQLPAGIVDLVVTSPPYDELRDYNGYEFDYKAIITALHRVLKPGGIVVWVVNDGTIDKEESGTSFRHAWAFKKLGFKLHDTMIYEKTGAAFPANRNGNRYTQIFEYMFVFTKGKPKTSNLICDKRNRWFGWCNWGKNTLRTKEGELKKQDDTKAIPEFSPRNNIWKFSAGAGHSYTGSADERKLAKKHPAVFPENLVRDHILSWSNPGDTVLDPMCGSGTTLKMAYLEDRNYIGIDISEEYANLAKERMKFVEKDKPAYIKNKTKPPLDGTKDFEMMVDGETHNYRKIPRDKFEEVKEAIKQWRWIEPGSKIKARGRKRKDESQNT